MTAVIEKMRESVAKVSRYVYLIILKHTCCIVCSNGDIRLVGGSAPTEGRVEVCINNQWGTVCDDLWDNTDAGVACSQAGFSSEGAMAFTNARFGQGTGTIVLDDVQCTGTETRLVDCMASSTNDCTHSEDASVRCQRSKS